MRKSSILAANVAGASALALLLAASAFADNRPQDGTWRRGDHRDGQAAEGTRDGNRVQRTEGDRIVRHEGRGEQREAPSVESRDGGYRDGDRADGRADAYRAPAEDRSYRERGRNDGYRGDNHGSYDRRSYDRGRGSVRQYRDNDRVNMQGHISRYAHERGGYRVWLDNGPYAFWVPEARWRNNWRVGIGINIGGIFRAGTIYADVYDDPYYNDPYYNDAYGYRGGYAADYLTGYVDRIDYRTATMWLRDDRSGRIVTVDMRAVDGRYSRLDSRDLRRGDRVTFTGAWLRPGIFSADRIDSVDTGRY